MTERSHGGVPTVVNALAHAGPARIPRRREFADVAEAHLDDVLRYLLVFTADAGLADDLAGETFEKALRRWRRYDPRRASERALLCQIARSVALDHFRAEARRRRREERFAHEKAIAQEPQATGFSPELDAALASLTAGEREVIALRVVLDFDAENAARLLGIGRSACSMRLARALRSSKRGSDPMLTPELIESKRIEEVLAGAVPDTDAEARLQGLALALRSDAPAASSDLRERVRALGAARPRRPVLGSRRRVALVLAPLAVALVGGSIALGFLGVGSPGSETTERGAAVGSRHLSGVLRPFLARPVLTSPEAGAGARARRVDTWIELRLRDADGLSAAAGDAMRIARDLGGFVASSTVGTQGNEGRAELSLRLPVGRVDDALFRLSQLGAITSQRVRTEDRQADIDQAARQIESLRRAIRIAELRLASGTLGAQERLRLEIRLERLRGQLASVRRSSASLVREAATADLTLVLHTRAAAGGKANGSGVGGIVGDAFDLLGRAGAVALFVAIVVSPLAVLALLYWLVRRRQLRRQEAHLLDRTGPRVPSPQPPPW